MGDIGDYDEPGHDHEPPPFRRRSITSLETTDGSEISVDHLFAAPEDTEPCPGCGGQCITPGLVGFALNSESALLTAEEALLVADRLTRGAHLVLEALEDPPDLSREAVRFGAPTNGMS